MYTMQQYRESADYIAARLGDFRPEILMVLGTGLGFLGDHVENPVVIPYGEIPHFRTSTVSGHQGRFVCGILAGRRVMVMQGRLHIYEGYDAYEVTYPVRVARLLGADKLVVTNAAGGVDTNYRVGDLMLISDHIRLFMPNPLIGPNLEEFGPRFCDMSDVYDQEYRVIARRKAQELGIRLQEGVYFYFTGPQFETPAEIRMTRVMGGDAVGMSTVPEAIAANHAGMKILGISLITNMAAGILDEKLDGDHVEAAAVEARERFAGLVLACLPELK